VFLKMKIISHLLFFLSGATMVAAQTPTILKDLYPGKESGFPTGAGLFPVNGKFYFSGYTPAHLSSQLMVTDGTSAGTVPAIATTVAVDISLIGSAGKRVFFKAFKGEPSLFVLDGATATKVRGFGGNGPFLNAIVPFDEQRVLLALNSVSGADPDELWVSDGTAQGTFLLGKFLVRPQFLVATRFGKWLTMYEKSTNGVKMKPLITDGTVAGTSTLQSWLAPWYKFEEVSSVYSAGDLLFISGTKLSGTSLFNKAVTTNGTIQGTKEINSSQEFWQVAKQGAKYLVYGDWRLVLFDPAANYGSLLSDAFGTWSQLLFHNGKVYFTNYNNPSLKVFLWEIDGSTPKSTGVELSNFYLRPPSMMTLGNYLYFTKNEASTISLQQYNLNTKALKKLTDVAQPGGFSYSHALGALGNQLIFSKDTDAQGNELWTLDLSTVGAQERPALSAAYRLEWFGTTGMGRIEGNDPGARLVLRRFDAQGRLIEQLESVEGATFRLQPFEGIGFLVAEGKRGVQGFKIVNM
jgi:hypothetical protein